MVSPANTNPSLTQGNDPNNKARPFEYYFRVATTDPIQGPFAANFAYNDRQEAQRRGRPRQEDLRPGPGPPVQGPVREERRQGPHRRDRRTRGQGLLGRPVQDQALQPRHDLLSAASTRRPRCSPARPTSRASRSRSWAVTASTPAPTSSVAKAAGEGDLATSVGAPTDKLPTAKSFVDAYQAAGYADPYEAYGAYSYDAANVIIAALAKVLAGRRRDRRRAAGRAAPGRPGRQHRRRDRQGGLRPVRRHHHPGPHRLQGRETRALWKPQETEEFK